MTRRALLVVIGVLHGCTGEIAPQGAGRDVRPGAAPTASGDRAPGAAPTASGDRAPGAAATPADSAPVPAAAPDPRSVTDGDVGFWRLTVDAYGAVLESALKKVSTASMPSTRPDPDVLPEGQFHNAPEELQVTDAFFEQTLATAQAFSVNARQKNRTGYTCIAAATPEAACVRGFVEAFARKAFRRPLTMEETGRYAALFTDLANRFGAADATGLVLQTILQSPHTLFSVRAGAARKPDARSRVRLTSHETAEAMALFVLGAPPDDPLTEAADRDLLGTRENVEAQVRRILRDPAIAKRGVARFFHDLFEVDRILGADKSKKNISFGYSWDRGFRGSMAQETRSFIDGVLWKDDGRLATLLTADYTYVGRELARDLYGLDATALGLDNNIRKVQLDPARRAGIITQPALLAGFSAFSETFPIRRGRFIREKFLCADLPAPPPEVDADPVPADPRRTMRQRLAGHVSQPNCAACHTMMDPIGLGLEHYDHFGRYRTEETVAPASVPVDASGAINMPGGATIPFQGARELATRLAKLPAVQDCFARRMFGYAVGRSPGPADDVSLQEIMNVFRRSDFDLKELVVAIASSDSFLHLATGGTP